MANLYQLMVNRKGEKPVANVRGEKKEAEDESPEGWSAVQSADWRKEGTVAVQTRFAKGRADRQKQFQ